MTEEEYFANLRAAKELYHHGVEGQHWGTKNGPPYPLDAAGKKAVKAQKKIDKLEKKASKAKGTKLGDLRTEIKFEKSKLDYENTREKYKQGHATQDEMRESGANFEKAMVEQSDNLDRRSRGEYATSRKYRTKALVSGLVTMGASVATGVAAVSASPIMPVALGIALTGEAVTSGQAWISNYMSIKSKRDRRLSGKIYNKYKNPNQDLNLDLED